MKKFIMILSAAGLAISANALFASEGEAPASEAPEMSAEEQCRESAKLEGVSEEETEAYVADCVAQREGGGTEGGSEEKPAKE